MMCNWNAVSRRNERHRSSRIRAQEQGGSRLHEAICCRQAGLVRNLRRSDNRDCARKGIEEVAASVEDSADWRAKSTLDRSIPASIDL